MMDDIERQLLGAERLEPQEELRARVLAATMPLVRRDGSQLDRMWFSRRWRVAAVVAAVVLVCIDALVRPSAPSVLPPGRAAIEAARTVEMAARDVGLTAAQAESLGAQALAEASQPSTRDVAADSLIEGGTR